jgi:cytochrome bd ubiquinol oxidase subunit II
MNVAVLLSIVMLVALVLYSLLGGADYGAGFLDLTCSGPRKEKQRAVIASAIHPVWETNHIWLILLVVLMFSGFPAAFSALGARLPGLLLLVLLGIILRGSSFVFRAYFAGDARTQLYWGRVFSISSSLTPFFLGMVIGAISDGSAAWSANSRGPWFRVEWLNVFPLSVGLLSLSLFAYLAATYLAIEAPGRELRDDFRRRALISGAVSVLAAILTYRLAGFSAPGIREGLTNSALSWTAELGAVFAAFFAFRNLILRRYERARMAAAAQVGLIVIGWAGAQFPYAFRPDVTFFNSAAPTNVVWDLLLACGAGGLVLFPSLYLLFRVFKRRPRTGADLESTLLEDFLHVSGAEKGELK